MEVNGVHTTVQTCSGLIPLRLPCHACGIFVILCVMNALRQRLPVFLESGVLLLLAFSILWRGGKGLEATWLLGGLAVAATFIRWWSAGRSRSAWSVPLDLWIGVMLFVLWTAVSFAFSETRNYGLDEVIRDGGLVMMFLWAAGTPRDVPTDTVKSSFDRWMSVIAITTVIACSIGVAVYVLQPVNRFVGTFFDMRFHTDYWPNAWAEFLLLAWPAVFLWSGRFPRALRAVILGIVFGSLFLSFSRGAILVFCGQIALGMIILGGQWIIRRQPPRGAILHAGFTGVAAVLIGAALFLGVNTVRSRFHDVESVTAKATFTASEGGSSISERRSFWEQSIILSQERPFFGWGPYSFRFVHPRLQTGVFATSDHAHNVFLKLAMERGWPAALLFLFILLRILVSAVAAQIRGTGSALRLVLIVGVTGVAAHNLIDYNLQFVGIALPLWLFLGALAPERGISGRRLTYVRMVEILVAVILGCILVIEGRFLVLSSLGRHAEATGDIPAALQWYERAHGELFSRDMHLSRSVLLQEQGDNAGAEDALDEYAAANAYDARLWILRGRLVEQQGDENLAYGEYGNAFVLGRYNYLEPLEGMLRLNPQRVDRVEAEAVFRSFGDAILQNTHFIALSQSVETFERISTLLPPVSPSAGQELRAFTTKVLEHAQEERQKLSSRPPGFLW